MRVATDIGGTFTDLVYMDENGNIKVDKTSTTPPNFEKGVMDVIKKNDINKHQMKQFIHGSTVVINAITERKGVKTALITTKGFKDVLEIARGNRPDLFNIRYEKPTPFVERYLRKEVEERLNYKGKIIQPLKEEEIIQIINELKVEGVEAIGVVYLHSYINPIHELETKKIIQNHWPEVFVTVSHEVTMEWREYERASTTVLNAYVQPIASTYIDKLQNEIKKISDGKNYIMQSNGGTTTFEQAKKLPINMLESGPVAGVYASAILGAQIGESNIIAFDIGGTTAKCSLIEDGVMKVSTDYYIEKNSRTAGYPVKVPVVDIVEIGNGGGSIAWIDEGGSLKVGPQSAGALPGPVAYNKGGMDPTTTDANLIIGRLSPKNFDYKVDMRKVAMVLEERIAKAFNLSVEEAALGIIRIANANMLTALKLISIRKGHDPRNFTLVAFGGGGSMHAASLAKELGVKKVVIPFASPVFSAWGMLMTDLRHDFIQTYVKRLSELDLVEVNEKWQDIESKAIAQFKKEEFEETVVFTRYVDIRYLGQEHTVKVPASNGNWTEETIIELINNFHELHEKNFTFRLDGSPTEIVSFHLVALGNINKPSLKETENSGLSESAIIERRPVYFEKDGWVETTIYKRDMLPTEVKIVGPAIIEEKAAVTIIEKGQKVYADIYGNLIIVTGVDTNE
ncbi:hydantoinase/oxoprolinase family protein [Psychrobacillus sp. FSL K6-2836]|uniref:hydantoinase/oxoprolinase family protein n=1 Tax=Psychrobacillus sp. FSL K6-2836 TaxID=2921548 RepID=UPI0030FC3D64